MESEKLKLIAKILENHLPYIDESGIISFTLQQFVDMILLASED